MDGEVLVTGASGYIGSRLVEELLARGISVRAMSRRPLSLAHLARRGVQVVEADVTDRRSLGRALEGIRRAYYLVHSMEGAQSEGAFAEYDRYAAHNFALEGRHLERVVYLGGLGNPEDHLSPHLRSRLEVGQILMEGPAPVTVLRAGIVIGSGSASFLMLRHLVERLPVMICPVWVETRCQPIAVRDVLHYLVAGLEAPGSGGRSFDIGGPEVLTYRALMDRVAAIMGIRHLILTVPVLTPRLSSYWVDLVTSVPASVAHPLIEGLRNEVVVRDDTAAEIIPVDLTPLDEAIRLALTDR